MPVSVRRTNNSVFVGGLAGESGRLEELPANLEAVKKEFTADVSKIKFDMKNVGPTNHNAIALVVACAALPSAKSAVCEFENASGPTMDALRKIGLENGKFQDLTFKPQEPSSIFVSVGKAVLKLVADIAQLVGYAGEIVRMLWYFLRHPGKMNFRELLYYADRTGADAVPIVLLICFLMGLILAFQGLGVLSRFGLGMFVSNLVGLSIVRELGPLMVAIICTGRAGSSFAAEIGTMKVNEEIDAMKTMGLKPVRALAAPKILALIIVMPMLTILGDCAGVLGGGLMTAAISDIGLSEYFSRTLDSMIPANLFESVIKGFVFAFLVAAIGCYRGFEADNDAKGVGDATTSSVVSGIFLIILADTAITFVFPRIMALFGVVY